MMFDGLITRKWAHNCSRDNQNLCSRRRYGIPIRVTCSALPNAIINSLHDPLACAIPLVGTTELKWILARRTKLSMFHQVIAANG